jgi:hypothetical protein
VLEASQLITESGTYKMPQLSKFTDCLEAVTTLLIRVDAKDLSRDLGISGDNMYLGAVTIIVSIY